MGDVKYPTATPAMVKDIMAKDLVITLDDCNDTIRVILGRGKDQLRLDFSAKLLGLHSAFFRVKAEYDPLLPRAENKRPTIDLSEQDIDALSVFFSWNTTGDIYSAKRLVIPKANANEVVTTQHLDRYRILWDQLLECYFLADFLGAPVFANATMDALFEAIDNEYEDRERLEVKSEVVTPPRSPSLGTDGNQNNHFHAGHVDDIDDDEDNDEDDDGVEWMFKDPFEKKQPQQEPRQMLGTLPYQIERVYVMTKRDSLLRRMLVDKIIAQGYRSDQYSKIHNIMEEGLPLVFLRDLTDELMRTAVISSGIRDYRVLGAHSRVQLRCIYHIHKGRERCKVSRNDNGWTDEPGPGGWD